jgi:hypothetical protein
MDQEMSQSEQNSTPVLHHAGAFLPSTRALLQGIRLSNSNAQSK